MRQKSPRLTFTTALEGYIESTVRSFDEDIARAETTEERKDWQISKKISLWEVDCAQKYKLTSSALAMIARLKPEHSSPIKQLPGTGIWLVLDNAEMSNLYFSSIPQAALSYVEIHPNAVLGPKWQPVVNHPWQWTLDITQLGKHPLSYAYHAERGLWTLNIGQLCPAKQCEMTGKDSDGWPGWYICPECRPAFDHWTAWLPIALMAINGDFAETEEHQERQTLTTHEKRKIRRPGGAGGYTEKTLTHHWQIVTFDLSVKPQPQPAESGAHDEPLHPTWLEKAIADETVVYVAKHIQETQRTFRHERYKNMRGKTIEVRAYDKRVPMSVAHLKQTIYRTIASKAE
jgi:hypothetical protein